MRKFLAGVAVSIAAVFLLPVLLAKGEPLVGGGASEPAAGGIATFAPTAEPSREPSAPWSEPTLPPSAAPSQEPPVGAIEVAVPETDELPAAGEDELPATVIRVLGAGEMDLEDYVAGVVAAEMSPEFPTEARRAQAVAVRSLALYRKAHPKHGEDAVCTSAGCCMALGEADAGAIAAAQDTAGVVATYDGEPIMAAFFASTDGRTASAAQVWGGAVPYLTAVDSPEVRRSSGHGVGMSQRGAEAMALEGAGYEDILKHYYTGIEVG